MKAEFIEHLRGLPQFVRSRVLEQEEALREILDVVLNVEFGLRDAGEPRACIMAFGPTGVGKTETFLALAEYLYGSPDALIRYDMSEFGTDASLPMLLGDRAGDPGQIVGRLQARESSGGIILWDEFEKAAPAVRNLFLAMLSSAKVTNWAGVTINLSNFYMCATSNVGGARTGRAEEGSDHATLQQNLLNEAATVLSPELLGRFAIKPLFRALGDCAQRQVAALLLSREAKLVHHSVGSELTWSEEVLSRVVEWGFDQRLGARPMRDNTRVWVRTAVRELLMQDGTSPRPARIHLTAEANAYKRLTAQAA